MVKIYTLADPETSLIRYIGKTKQPLNKRYNNHISDYRLNKEKSHKNSWIISLKQRGLKPIIEVLDEVLEEDWILVEQYWISQLKTWGFNLTNMTSGGEGCVGGGGCLGYKHTPQAKAAISIKNSGPKTTEWNAKVKESVRKSVGRPILQFSTDGVLLQEYKSFYEACEVINTEGNPQSTKKNIHACCNNKRKTAYGYQWRYKNVEVRDKELLR